MVTPTATRVTTVEVRTVGGELQGTSDSPPALLVRWPPPSPRSPTTAAARRQPAGALPSAPAGLHDAPRSAWLNACWHREAPGVQLADADGKAPRPQ